MSEIDAGRNKALVLKAFDTLFNKRDYAAAEGFWSAEYIQHSAHIEDEATEEHSRSKAPMFGTSFPG